MITKVRVMSFLVAIVIVFFSVFWVDPAEELALARYAVRHYDDDQAMRHARRVAWGNDQTLTQSAYAIELTIATDRKQYDYALRVLNKWLDSNPECVNCYLRRGDIYYQKKQFKQALDNFNQGLGLLDTIENKYSYYFTRRGLAQVALGNLALASRDAKTALSLNNASPLAHFLMSQLLNLGGDIKGAAEQAKIAYDLGKMPARFFSSEEGDQWLRYYSQMQINARHLSP